LSKSRAKRARRAAKTSRPRFNATTLAEVAATAGVSSATVSRFFNFPQILSVETARRVRDAVRNVGYVPNLLAGGLASSRSRLIAAAIPAISQSIFSSTIQSLTDSLSEEGYSVMLGLTGANDEHVQRQLQSMIGRRPDGIILTGTMLDAAARRQLKATGTPTIETWDLPDDPIDLVVGFSHQAVGVAVARRALALGRRQALVVSATGVRALARRYSFARTMLENGAFEPAVSTFTGPSTYGRARRAVAAHLDSGQRADLIVCSSDWGAHGVLDELRQRGMRVPDDVAVIGFGDLDFAAELNPSLTTVKIDGAVIGKHAARFLMLRARGQAIDNPVVNIGFSLIERQSG
jgi:LacI family transcriptional regulator, gluconate utilization system Gnt-I transcriptional repressor